MKIYLDNNLIANALSATHQSKKPGIEQQCLNWHKHTHKEMKSNKPKNKPKKHLSASTQTTALMSILQI